MWIVRCGCLAAVLSLGAASLSAQTALTGALQGSIADPSGAAVPAAAVKLSSERLSMSAEAESGVDGSFRFVRLTPGADYILEVSADGFEPYQAAVEILSGEAVSHNPVLRVGGGLDTIDVTDVSPGLARDSAELSTVVDARALHDLPTNGRNLVRFALLDARVRNPSGLGGDSFAQNRLSINANTFRDTQHRLDGDTNYDTLFNNTPLQRVPLTAVREFRVLTNQFNAEHGSTSAGLTITTTKSGTDEWHGEGFFLVRPSGIQARPPLATMHIPNQLLQEGFAAGGPLAGNRTYLFASYERSDQERGSFISSPQPDFFVGELRDNMAVVKLDHRFDNTHWMSLRLNGHRDTNTNPNNRVGGLLQPNAANLAIGQSAGLQLTDTKTWGRTVNEFRAGYVNAIPSSTQPIESGLVVVRPGFSTEGAATFSQARAEVYQLADQISWQTGSHTIKAGGDFIRRKVRDRQFDQFGTYQFAGGAPTPGQQPLLYSQRFGVADLSYGQTQWAGFIQDTWRATQRLTLNIGVRYDYQSLLDDRNNFGPRFSFNWDPTGGGDLVIRGGFGMYYDQPFFHGLTQRFLLNALDAPFATFSLAPNNPAFPTFPFSYAPDEIPSGLTAAPRNVALRGDSLLAPYTTQFTLGFQKSLPDRWVLSADVTRSLTVKQFLQYDINQASPFVRTQAGQTRTVAEADRTRPFYDAERGVSIYQGVPVRQVRMTTNGNTANYHSLTLNLNRRFGERFFAGFSHNWASAMNSITDDHLGANPQEWSDVQRGERGPSDFLQRHRFVANGSVELPWSLRVSAYAVAASGLPVNALTGVDNNGDGTVVDRPAGFGRNAFRGTPHYNFDMAVIKPIPLSENIRVELRAEGFNLFNRNNFYLFNRVFGNGAAPVGAFLSPLGGIANADPGRQFTFGAKFLF